MPVDNSSPWPPVEMVLRSTAGGAAGAPTPAAAAAPASGATGNAVSVVDTAAVAECVFRLMQRDLRLEHERVYRAGGSRWRVSR